MKIYRVDAECTRVKFINYVVQAKDEIKAEKEFLRTVMMQKKEFKYINIKEKNYEN